MRVCLVARDAAPSRAFHRVVQTLPGVGVTKVETFLGDGKPIGVGEQMIREAVRSSDVLLCGMSSSPELAREEMSAAAFASREGVPYGFFADTFGVIKRPHLIELRGTARFILTINEEEAREARTLFPNARVVASGNPLWEDFFFPTVTNGAVRGALGIATKAKMILVAGGKNEVVNVLLFGGVFEAVHRYEETIRGHHLVFTIHPGDTTAGNAYRDFVRWSNAPVSIVTKDIVPSSSLVPAADVVVNFVSSLGIEAACQRKPVIEYFTKAGLAHLEEMIGSRNWPPCTHGVAEAVYDPHDLAGEMSRLSNPVFFEPMRARQEAVFPKPMEYGTAVRIMVATLRECAKQ